MKGKLVGNKAKGQISKRMLQIKNKAVQIFREMNVFYPLIRTRTCAHQGVRNVHFLENLDCFTFFLLLFRDSPFCLITDELLTIKKFAVKIKLERMLGSIKVK